MTESMQKAIDETSRRRALQQEYNERHGITPETIRKNVRSGIELEVAAHRDANAAVGRGNDEVFITEEYLQELEGEMMAAAEEMEFERAAASRDRIKALRDSVGQVVATRSGSEKARRSRGSRGRTGAKVPRPRKR
jgi:excinuclease ABC subunit B